jgi:hypothetical protein
MESANTPRVNPLRNVILPGLELNLPMPPGAAVPRRSRYSDAPANPPAQSDPPPASRPRE